MHTAKIGASVAGLLLLLFVGAFYWTSGGGEPREEDNGEPSDEPPVSFEPDRAPEPPVSNPRVSPRAEPPPSSEPKASPEDDFERTLAERLAALEDESAAARVHAIRWLESIADPELGDRVVPALVERLDDETLDVRALAVRALGEFGESAGDAVPRLVERLSEPELREVALATLGRLGPAAGPARDELMRITRSSDERSAVRRGALASLLLVVPDDPALVPLLRELEKDDNARLARAARAALTARGY